MHSQGFAEEPTKIELYRTTIYLYRPQRRLRPASQNFRLNQRDAVRVVWTRSEKAALNVAKHYFAFGDYLSKLRRTETRTDDKATRLEIEKFSVSPAVPGLCAHLNRKQSDYAYQFKKKKLRFSDPTQVYAWKTKEIQSREEAELTDTQALTVNEEERAWQHWLNGLKKSGSYVSTEGLQTIELGEEDSHDGDEEETVKATRTSETGEGETDERRKRTGAAGPGEAGAGAGAEKPRSSGSSAGRSGEAPGRAAQGYRL